MVGLLVTQSSPLSTASAKRPREGSMMVQPTKRQKEDSNDCINLVDRLASTDVVSPSNRPTKNASHVSSESETQSETSGCIEVPKWLDNLRNCWDRRPQSRHVKNRSVEGSSTIEQDINRGSTLSPPTSTTLVASSAIQPAEPIADDLCSSYSLSSTLMLRGLRPRTSEEQQAILPAELHIERPVSRITPRNSDSIELDCIPARPLDLGWRTSQQSILPENMSTTNPSARELISPDCPSLEQSQQLQVLHKVDLPCQELTELSCPTSKPPKSPEETATTEREANYRIQSAHQVSHKTASSRAKNFSVPKRRRRAAKDRRPSSQHQMRMAARRFAVYGTEYDPFFHFLKSLLSFKSPMTERKSAAIQSLYESLDRAPTRSLGPVPRYENCETANRSAREETPVTVGSVVIDLLSEGEDEDLPDTSKDSPNQQASSDAEKSRLKNIGVSSKKIQARGHQAASNFECSSQATTSADPVFTSLEANCSRGSVIIEYDIFELEDTTGPALRTASISSTPHSENPLTNASPSRTHRDVGRVLQSLRRMNSLPPISSSIPSRNHNSRKRHRGRRQQAREKGIDPSHHATQPDVLPSRAPSTHSNIRKPALPGAAFMSPTFPASIMNSITTTAVATDAPANTERPRTSAKARPSQLSDGFSTRTRYPDAGLLSHTLRMLQNQSSSKIPYHVGC